MLKLGEKIISDIYLGDKKIAKVFLGDKLVYQAGKPIFLDYVVFDGASWIDTGYKPNSNSSVSTTYYPYNSDAFICIFGTQDTASTNRFYAVISLTRYKLQVQSANTGGFWGVNSTGLVNSSNGTFASTQQKVGLTIDNYNKQVSIESDELTKTFDMATYTSLLGTVDCQYNLLLGNRSTAGVPSTANAFKGKIHDFQIKESGELIQDLRPCIDPKGVVCMYDMVTKKYFYNQGTGTLTAGNVIKFVDYIITDGSSYIDTEYCPNENTYIEYTFEVTQRPVVDWSGLFGSRAGIGSYTYNVFATGFQTFRIDYGKYDETGHPFKLNTKYTMKAGNNEVYINNELVKSYTNSYQGTSPYSMFLGNFNNAGTPYTTGTSQKIYPCPIYENGVLVGDFRPCVVAGEAGFYDMVTGKLFYNQGTGKLEYT